MLQSGIMRPEDDLYMPFYRRLQKEYFFLSLEAHWQKKIYLFLAVEL
jgi:hypothetical protein